MAVAELLPDDVLAQPTHESHWCISVVFSEAGVVASVAGTAADVPAIGVHFDNGLISSSGLQTSLGSSADRCDINVQNTNWWWSQMMQTVITVPMRADVGRIVRPVRGGTWQYMRLLTGIAAVISSDEQQATIQVIGDLYASATVGAIRAIARPCQWKFKDARTCGYTGPETVCNKIFESTDGCLGRNNQHRYGGFLYQTDKDSLTVPPPDPNQNPDPGGGGIGGTGKIEINIPNPHIIETY